MEKGRRRIFDMAVTEKESRTFKVMAVLAVFAAVLFIVFSTDLVHSFGFWEYVRYYSLGLLVGSLIAMLFIWFVNTDGTMVSVSSISMFLVTIIGFGIVIVSVIQYIILPSTFNGMILVFGLGLSTIVFALGI